MKIERSINIAFDKKSGEVLDANQIFTTSKNAFEIRRQFHKKDIELYCCECYQELNISSSKYDRLHFKHQPNSDTCILKYSKFSQKEIHLLKEYYKSKESPRHIELKNKIGLKLKNIKGLSLINIDDKFIIDEKERRKPDVYCELNKLKIAFEIQLSNLSLRYILGRYEFYKRNGIYLIWILDNFDLKSQNQMVKDIKYLNEYQNFFKLDEKSDFFKLICSYKYPFLTDRNKLLTKWIEKSISINQLKFDNKLFQIYYYNFRLKLEEKHEEQIKNIQKLKQEEEEEKQFLRQEKQKEKVNFIIEKIKCFWKKEIANYKEIKKEIFELDEFGVKTLNNSSAFKSPTDEPRIFQWFRIANRNHYAFLEFVLECNIIDLNVNFRYKNESLLKVLFENKKIEHYISISRSLLKRGYLITTNEESIIKDWLPIEKDYVSEILLYKLSNKLKNNTGLIDKLFYNRSLICTIESAKQNRIIGFGYKDSEWIAFANNAISSYKAYWEYIEIAFKEYGIWEKLIKLDKKGTFQKKLNSFYQERRKANYDCNLLLNFLYPELYDDELLWLT